MSPEFLSWKNIFIAFVVVLALLTTGFSFLLNKTFPLVNHANVVLEHENDLGIIEEESSSFLDGTALVSEPSVEPSASVRWPSQSNSVVSKKLENPPEIIKAIYVTGWSAGSKNYLSYLSSVFESTEINAVVIDIKDYSGLVSYFAEVKEVKKYNLVNGAIYDIDSLVKFFHNKNIYVIGRISIFEDPAYAKARPELAIYDEKAQEFTLWEDYNGLNWLDPASKDVWDYNIALAKNAFFHGFDEINFDYIRFPSDGEIESAGFPVWDQKTSMASVIKEFFEYLRAELKGEVISADLFGQTTTSYNDMGIGQFLENAFASFDYISPMVYPSHYIGGFMGFENPAEYPYEVVKYSLDSAILRKNDFFGISSVTESDQKIFKFRPWLQDFDMGADYTSEMVRREIQAVKDSLKDDYCGFMLWNSSNIYTLEAVSK